ncbi:MAG: tellurium resistance protein [Nakamurella sp.]
MAIDYTKRPSQPTPAAAAPPIPPTAAPAGSVAPPARAGRVTLTKGAPKVSLTKSGAAGGIARVNLNWSALAPTPPAAPAGGFLARMKAAAAVSVSKGIDLDLGCLYELADGRKGVIQALGNAFGSLNAAPWISLDGDDRTGQVTGGENMSINLSQPGRFKRVLIFAMIYEGAPNWAAVDGVVTLTPANGQPIEVRLDATEAAVRMCAVAQLVDTGGELVFQREVRYIEGGQVALDKAFGWGMNWARGRK